MKSSPEGSPLGRSFKKSDYPARTPTGTGFFEISLLKIKRTMRAKYGAMTRALNDESLQEIDIDILMVAIGKRNLTVTAMYVFEQLRPDAIDWTSCRQKEKAQEIYLPRLIKLSDLGYLNEINPDDIDIFSDFSISSKNI